ncbi:MAG: hypothetical protein JKX91_14855, partial [Rhizobiaceae bacterium]|nr:hypothetical protein [Rhizobiaceae bacterium]
MHTDNMCGRASISFASPLDTSVAYGLHVVSVDVDIGKYITASEIKRENENLVAVTGGGDDTK